MLKMYAYVLNAEHALASATLLGNACVQIARLSVVQGLCLQSDRTQPFTERRPLPYDVDGYITEAKWSIFIDPVKI